MGAIMARLATAFSLAALLAIPAQAHAADAGNWTGIYGGVNATAVGTTSNGTGSNIYTTNDGGEGSLTRARVLTAPNQVLNTEGVATHLNSTSGGGGLRLGYNLQTGIVVLGVEGDVNFASFNSEQGGLGSGPAGANEGYAISAHGSVVGTVRARAGFVVDRVLIFGTGGVAFTDLRNTLTTNSGFVDSERKTTGWTAGGGAEVRVSPRFSIAATVLYADFGTTTLSGGDGTSGFTADVKSHQIIGALGVNVHF